MKYLLSVLILVVALSAQDSNDQLVPEKLPIAVLTLEGRGISPMEADILTERMRSILVQDGRYQVVERSQMDVILEEQGFQLSGCVSNECMIQAGLILGVQQMVGGTIGLLGDSYALDIRLFEIESAQILKAVTRNYNGPVDGLLTEISAVARELSGGGEPARTIPVTSAPTTAELTFEQGIAAVDGAFKTMGTIIDTTAKSVAKMLKGKPKDPDIEHGKTQGELDAQDYRYRFVWLLPTLATTAAATYTMGAPVEDQLSTALVTGLITKWVVKTVAGTPRLSDDLVKKISSESTVYQENYRRAWQKEVKQIRDNRLNSGCILGVAIGYTALYYEPGDVPWE